MDTFKSIWRGDASRETRCCHCGQAIGPTDILARTFVLRIRGESRSGIDSAALEIEVPESPTILLLRDRHLQCLFAVTRYVVVSMVTPACVTAYHDIDPDVEYPDEHVETLARTVCQEPAHIAQVLDESRLAPDAEIWHPYLSIPHWDPKVESRIGSAFPDLIAGAERTVVHLRDVSSRTIETMRHGAWLSDRVHAISDVCNSTWFAHARTVADYLLTPKNRLCVVLSDFALLEPWAMNKEYGKSFGDEVDIVKEVGEAWVKEVKRSGEEEPLENIVGVGTGDDLVPWMLGPLDEARARACARMCDRKGLTFAEVFEILGERCEASPGDFLHAFLGTLGMEIEDALHLDMEDVMQQTARKCLEKGDHSPLFMVPRQAQTRDESANGSSLRGFDDTRSFGLGLLFTNAPPAIIRIKDDMPLLKVELLGTMTQFRTFEWETPQNELFSQLIDCVLECTGADVGAFVNTLAVRLYGQDHDGLSKHIAEGRRKQTLKQRLCALQHQKSLGMRPALEESIAETLCLSKRIDGALVTKEACSVGFWEDHDRGARLGSFRTIMAVECQRCLETFLLRVRIFEPLDEASTILAYRLPELRCQSSRDGGMGLLLKEGHIVGHLIRGIPTCECLKFEEVKVRLQDVPAPQPARSWHRRTPPWRRKRVSQRETPIPKDISLNLEASLHQGNANCSQKWDNVLRELWYH
ncbi:hypothetical protein F5Y15DRAFT_93417 [Xylariaceae sp. FL0016]|nr:hypothetical protein F5Y15DRAFT_93417 [Xylariaceae sp. FL0016]